MLIIFTMTLTKHHRVKPESMTSRPEQKFKMNNTGKIFAFLKEILRPEKDCSNCNVSISFFLFFA